MSMVLGPAQIDEEARQIREMVEGIAGALPAVQWRYSAYSSERFPLRAYASALRGSGPEADEVLVIEVIWQSSRDEQGDRLLMSAGILDEDGVILAESSAFEVPIPEGSAVRSSPERALQDVTQQVRVAMLKVRDWLTGQTETIRQALIGAA